MAEIRRLAAARVLAPALAAGALAAAVPVASAAASRGRPRRARPAQVTAALRSSPQLWATIDVCNPPDQRYTIGIRGSMPGDGNAHDSMFMRFRLQHVDSVLRRWADLANAASRFIAVGSSGFGREGGVSFTLYRPPSGTSYMLRGVVTFQWRHGSQVLGEVSRPTRSAHPDRTGSDPRNFSAATCHIG
jgi:hypothetical protein